MSLMFIPQVNTIKHIKNVAQQYLQHVHQLLFRVVFHFCVKQTTPIFALNFVVLLQFVDSEVIIKEQDLIDHLIDSINNHR